MKTARELAKQPFKPIEPSEPSKPFFEPSEKSKPLKSFKLLKTFKPMQRPKPAVPKEHYSSTAIGSSILAEYYDVREDFLLLTCILIF